MNGTVFALAIYNGDLVAGGNFTQAGGVAANYIARWNGSSWAPLGSGLTASVGALANYNGELVAAGGFSSVNGSPFNRIARWNGIQWSALGTGVDGDIRGMAVFQGELVVGGLFQSAGGQSAVNIARWNGAIWAELGSGTDDWVQTLAVFNNELIAGGNFANAGGIAAAHIARWNGSDWSAVGSGVDFNVFGLKEYNGALVAGGASPVPVVARVASWDGNSWTSLGMPFSSINVSSFENYNGDLIAVGAFSVAGGIASPNIAAHGPTHSTQSTVVGTLPAPSVTGESVQISVEVSADVAPTEGHVTVNGSPGGSCTDLTLSPINATTSLAQCSIQWNTACARELVATYVGGTDGVVTWQPSTSPTTVHAVSGAVSCVQLPLFQDGFEG